MSDYWKREHIPHLRAANPRAKKWSDAKVLRVFNREHRKQEKKLRKSRAKHVKNRKEKGSA